MTITYVVTYVTYGTFSCMAFAMYHCKLYVKWTACSILGQHVSKCMSTQDVRTRHVLVLCNNTYKNHYN